MEEQKYLIWSLEHKSWWGANHCGYTPFSEAAGKYSFEEAKKILAESNPRFCQTPSETMIPAWEESTIGVLDESLPVIYGFNNGGPASFLTGIAMAEDGEFLSSHVCSCEGWMQHDLGMDGICTWKHEIYNKKYPNGWRTEFVSYRDIPGHEGLQKTLAKANERQALLGADAGEAAVKTESTGETHMKNETGVIDWAIMGVILVVSIVAGVLTNGISQQIYSQPKVKTVEVYSDKAHSVPKMKCFKTINKGDVCVNEKESEG